MREAVKWVLGDQRPSAMRGKSMTDVIFLRVRKRAVHCRTPKSICISTTKTAFSRSNRTTWFLGRKKSTEAVSANTLSTSRNAALKTSSRFLHDTGIGREGYSIVGQGRVAQIIQAKPIDRRSIFEEAAGIANFKAQKDETERKLDRANESLARVKRHFARTGTSA
ncbi:MAG: hypothetical protein L6V85_06835 [Clostridiales bacterium]|nr:MAG: hypothetical protein L6V85_06835 [Clostridiales bacterium]